MRGRVAVVAVLMAAAMVVVVVPFTQPTPSAGAEPVLRADRGLVGALVHSRWLHPSSPVPLEHLADLVRGQGLEVVPVGLPLGDAEGRAAALPRLERWLELTAGIPALPSINTFALPPAQQDADGLRAVFQRVAPVVDGRDAQVLAILGANEPLTKGKKWANAALAEDRVRLEHRLWHEVSDQPFCHKFTNPRINVAGADWPMLERLWTEAQDAICYDWYASNGDTLETLDYLLALGKRLGKPVHIPEVAVPADAPEVLQAMAHKVDTVAIYQLLSSAGGEDERLSCFVLRGAAFDRRGPADMLATVLAGRGMPPA